MQLLSSNFSFHICLSHSDISATSVSMTAAVEITAVLQQAKLGSEEERIAVVEQIRVVVQSGNPDSSIVALVAIEFCSDPSPKVRRSLCDLLIACLQIVPRCAELLLPYLSVLLRDPSAYVIKSLLSSAQSLVPFLYPHVLSHLADTVESSSIIGPLEEFTQSALMLLAASSTVVNVAVIRFIESVLSSSTFSITMLEPGDELETAFHSRVSKTFEQYLHGLFTRIDTKIGLPMNANSITCGCAVINVLARIMRSPFSVCAGSTELVLQCLQAIRDFTVAVVNANDPTLMNSSVASLRHTARAALVSVVSRVFEITTSASSILFITLKESFAAADAAEEFASIRRRYMTFGTTERIDVARDQDEAESFAISRKRDLSKEAISGGESKRPKVVDQFATFGIVQDLYSTPFGSLSAVQMAEKVIKTLTTRFSTLKPVPLHLRARDGGTALFAEFVNAISVISSTSPVLPIGAPSPVSEGSLDLRGRPAAGGIGFVQPLMTTAVPLDVVDEDPLEFKEDLGRREESKPVIGLGSITATAIQRPADEELTSEGPPERSTMIDVVTRTNYEEWMSDFCRRFLDAQVVLERTVRRRPLFIWVARMLVRDLASSDGKCDDLSGSSLRELARDRASAQHLGLWSTSVNRLLDLLGHVGREFPAMSSDASVLCMLIHTSKDFLSDSSRDLLHDFVAETIVQSVMDHILVMSDGSLQAWIDALFGFVLSMAALPSSVLDLLVKTVVIKDASETCISKLCELARLRKPIRYEILRRLLSMTKDDAGQYESATCSLNREDLISLLIKECLSDARFHDWIVEFSIEQLKELSSTQAAGLQQETSKLEDLFTRSSGLFLEIVIHDCRLLRQMFELYSQLPSFQQYFRVRFSTLGREKLGIIGRSSHFLSLVRDPVPNSESLVLYVLDLVCPVLAAEVDVVNRLAEAVRDAYSYRKYSDEVLLPVLGFGVLPKMVVVDSLPGFLLKGPGVFETAIQRILSSGITGIFASDILVLGHSLTPAHFPGANYTEDNAVRAQMEFVNRCLAFRTFFSEKSIATALQRMAEFPKIPLLFMRTMLMALDRYSSLVDVCLSIMMRLIEKQVWTQSQLWKGYLRCLEVCAPRCVDVLLRLPPTQFREVLTEKPSLKALIADTVDPSQLTSSQQLAVYARQG